MVVSAPLTAQARLVSQGVENLPHLDLAGPPAGLGGRDQGLEDLPLGVLVDRQLSRHSDQQGNLQQDLDQMNLKLE